VHWFDGSDRDIVRAVEGAQATFRYFWRELSWERRRIVAAYDAARVKAMFTDGQNAEHMWVDELDFDGRLITGTLLNEPHSLTTVHAGDSVELPFPDRLSDWMLVAGDRVFGAFTVNAMRLRMPDEERAAHDQAWGLSFGDPRTVTLVHDPNHPDADHPMAVNMLPKLADFLRESPEVLTEPDPRGWTMLHVDSLAGNAPIVAQLLEHGANPFTRTKDGATPLDLARSLEWQRVIELLVAASGS
jgi:uncharacterized protein YegJ (DUF2314 family)